MPKLSEGFRAESPRDIVTYKWRLNVKRSVMNSENSADVRVSEFSRAGSEDFSKIEVGCSSPTLRSNSFQSKKSLKNRSFAKYRRFHCDMKLYDCTALFPPGFFLNFLCSSDLVAKPGHRFSSRQEEKVFVFPNRGTSAQRRAGTGGQAFLNSPQPSNRKLTCDCRVRILISHPNRCPVSCGFLFFFFLPV